MANSTYKLRVWERLYYLKAYLELMREYDKIKQLEYNLGKKNDSVIFS